MINLLKLQFLYFHIELPTLSWASLFHLHLSQSHSYASIPQKLNTGDVGGRREGVVEMTNQNPQLVVVMPSSGWYEHYLVCQRVLPIFRGKGRIRQFKIPPKILPKNVLSLDRSNWGEVFTVIAKDTLHYGLSNVIIRDQKFAKVYKSKILLLAHFGTERIKFFF